MQVVVVLGQRSDVVKRYVEDTGLPFDILLDESRAVAKAYGVWHRIGLDAWNTMRPALFFIDAQGAIRYSFIAAAQHEFPSHEEILSAISPACSPPAPCVDNA